jgi:hypothetical protein
MQNSLPNPPPPTMSTLGAVDWSTFFDRVQHAFTLHLASMEWPPENNPVFVEDFPKARSGNGYDTAFDVILWNVHSSRMATTAKQGINGPIVPHGLQLRVRRPSPTKLGYLEETWGWSEQMTAQFTVYAKSNQRANELVSWFHRMMMQYAFSFKFFQAVGVCDFRFEERLPDEKSQDFGQELYLRKLRYAVRINLQDVYEAKTLEDIHIGAGMTAGGEVASFDVNHDGQ